MKFCSTGIAPGSLESTSCCCRVGHLKRPLSAPPRSSWLLAVPLRSCVVSVAVCLFSIRPLRALRIRCALHSDPAARLCPPSAVLWVPGGPSPRRPSRGIQGLSGWLLDTVQAFSGIQSSLPSCSSVRCRALHALQRLPAVQQALSGTETVSRCCGFLCRLEQVHFVSIDANQSVHLGWLWILFCVLPGLAPASLSCERQIILLAGELP